MQKYIIKIFAIIALLIAGDVVAQELTSSFQLADTILTQEPSLQFEIESQKAEEITIETAKKDTTKFSFFKRKNKNNDKNFKFSLLGLVSGLLNGGTNYIVLYLAATEKASVLFPVVSVAKVIAVGIVGRIMYKERLKPLQITGIACGLTAIVLLNIK